MSEKQVPEGTANTPPREEDVKTQLDMMKEKILKDYDRMGLDDEFSFGCHPGVPCYNECCHDINIFLAPYDVLRMKNRIGMDSGDFLDKYTQIPLHKTQKFPVVQFRMRDDDEKLPCHFVKPEGCSIYEDRPWPCRMYPLGLASPKDDETGEEFYFLMKEDVCEGFCEKNKWTVRSWIENQEIEEYDEFGRLYKEICLHDYFKKGNQLTPEKVQIFYMATYDLDQFRRFIFESTFLKRFDIDEETLAKLKDDDTELLRFGFKWVRLACFGEPTVKIKPEAMGPMSTPSEG